MQFSKAAVRPAAAIPARYFSHTTRVAQNEESIVDEAIQATESLGSTAKVAPTLESSPTEAVRATSRSEGHGLFISNMTFDATDMHLREAFGKYGEILSVKIGRDSRGLSRGFGFLTFADKDAADRAVAETHKSFWHGRRINVEHRKTRDEPQEGRTSNVAPLEPTTSLYIGNIPYETSDADLNRLFRELDNVTDVRVAVDRNTGWPRGFAHADFTDVESAVKAHEKLSATAMGGRMLRIDYSARRESRPDRGPRA
ncbi:hypothetical protein BJ170DRAFT_677532 [Xylariales sp. AK1849]|nr:hypothetical protein BJ170DRAFT_677532 [Xylariales sp. AK1849]